ncbi:flagellar operon protein TIGR03826 [Amphibacillus marinus]|uniref:Flagellar operon protein TIGR03826 n=1 Tax=Amphibacillus marinus TaxID=872970 RepID=A0A1H8QZA7_9BACI|nr:TIGR03826 family flagellar region protein [Amphibacillus marinus]SEO59003.1 flagellar operon protein TIGR03826 [Amphibacillus marinus]
MGELENCSKCGNLFVKTMRSICSNCYKEEEKSFQKVYEFLKKRVNRKATIPEIVSGTGVEESLIIKFVKEKRLRTSQFPNLTYPCERCGNHIDEGVLCSSCSTELTSTLQKEDAISQVRGKQEVSTKERQHTYFAVDKVQKRN